MKAGEEMVEFQCLQTAVALMRVGIGRSDSMCSIRSALRELKSVIVGGVYGGERGGDAFLSACERKWELVGEGWRVK